MPESDKKSLYAFAAVFVGGISAIGLYVDRSDTLFLVTSYSCAFAAYLFLARSKNHFRLLIGIGLFARILLLFGMPTLSDDIYRFIWDGTLIANDMNPYAELPGYHLVNGVSGISPVLFELLNSPDYFTIYPPLNQAFFWIAVEVGKGSWLTSTNILRVILVGADIVAFFFLQRLLPRYGFSSHLTFFYFLNPLVVLEFTGNLHFEGLVVCFLLAGIYFFETNRKGYSAVAFGLGAATKLLPLMYLPFLFLKGLKNKKWIIAVGAGMLALLTLLPMLSAEFLQGVGTSFDLYFHRFEFNASVYFLAREIGFWIYGYNQIAIIGTIVAVASMVFILAISMVGWLKNWKLPETFLFILSAYLLLATTVHPWYAIPLIAFGLLSGYWYPIVWSFLIFLTYAGYTQDGFELPTLVIVVEYVVVILVAALEIFRKNAVQKNIHSHSAVEPD